MGVLLDSFLMDFYVMALKIFKVKLLCDFILLLSYYVHCQYGT